MESDPSSKLTTSQRKLNSSNSIILRTLALVNILNYQHHYSFVINKEKRVVVKGIKHFNITQIFNPQNTCLFDETNVIASNPKEKRRYCSAKILEIIIGELERVGYEITIYRKKAGKKQINGEVMPGIPRIKYLERLNERNEKERICLESLEKEQGTHFYQILLDNFVDPFYWIILSNNNGESFIQTSLKLPIDRFYVLRRGKVLPGDSYLCSFTKN